MLTLAPNLDETQQDLTSYLNAQNSVTSWVRAYLDNVLNRPDPIPSWYNTINQEFTQSQQAAQSLWVNSLLPTISAEIPQGIIDFADRFEPSAIALAELVNQIQKNPSQPNHPNPSQLSELRRILNQLLAEAKQHQDRYTSLAQAVGDFSVQITAAQSNLKQAAADAASSLITDQDKLEEIELQINKIQIQLGQHEQKITSSEISFGTSVLSTVVAFTIGLAAAGGVLAVGSLVGAVIGVGSAIISDIINTEEVKKDLEQLDKLVGDLTTEEAQVASLQSLISTIQQLAQRNESVNDSFPQLQRIWESTVERIQQVLEILKQPQVDVSKIDQLININTAQDTWTNLRCFAQNLQNSFLFQTPSLRIPEPSQLAPDNDSHRHLTDNFNGANLVTAYCHGLLNTVLSPAMNPPAAWFNTFESHLSTAQSHAQFWIDTLSPEVSAKVPQSILNYSGTFDPSIKALLNLLQQIEDEPTEAQAQEIVAVINNLLTVLQDQKNMLADTAGLFLFQIIDAQAIADITSRLDRQDIPDALVKAFQAAKISLSSKDLSVVVVDAGQRWNLKDANKMHIYTVQLNAHLLNVSRQGDLQRYMDDVFSDRVNLLEGQNSAENAVLLDQAQITQIQQKIQSLNEEIQLAIEEATISEIGLGLGIFVAVASLALAVATGGAAAPLVGLGVGLVGTGAGVVGSSIFNIDVNKDRRELQQDQQELSDEQRQVAALEGIIQSLGNLLEGNINAESGLINISRAWVTLEEKLQAVIDDLQQAERKQLVPLLESIDLRSAQIAWQQLTRFAMSVQQSTPPNTAMVPVIAAPPIMTEEEEALTLDLSPATTAQMNVSAFFQALENITNNALAINGASFPPVNVLGTEIDLLSNYPSVQNGIQALQQNARNWFSVGNGIGNVVYRGIPDYNRTFQAQTKIIQTTIQQIEKSGQLNSTHRQVIQSAFQTLISTLDAQVNNIKVQQVSLRTFVDTLTADHATLTQGENTIEKAIAGVQTDAENEALRYIGRIGGGGIAQIIIQAGSTEADGLRNIQTTLETLLMDNLMAQTSASIILTDTEAVLTKTTAVLRSLEKADMPNLLPILQEIDLEASQTAWQQLADFVDNLV